MSVFDTYARYYDLLYKDKDYLGDVQFIHHLIQMNAPHAKKLLELGCGTGNHAALLTNEDYHVYGVDISHEMIRCANERFTQLPSRSREKLHFTQGDIRQIRINQTFDVVLSLFHVISYQATLKELLAVFTTAKAHLKPGGIFIFDLWYGPAVLNDHPTARTKHREDERIKVTRTANPIMFPHENRVDVNYYFHIEDKESGLIKEFQETHPMRYWFNSEIETAVNEAGMQLLEYKEWVTSRQAGNDTWYVYFLVKNQDTASA